ncbi:MAG: methyltransferase type 11 [Acidimicrobiaceae bacterium]|nr:methyltransferase type 11 [Acidimicrobiaceae bacterium]
MSDRHLDRVYHTSSAPDEQAALYDDWAATYDDDLTRHRCETPDRLARALASVTDDRSSPVFDFGCGTGLSGLALARAGWTTIDGADLSAGMLDVAERKGVYRRLWQVDGNQLDVEPGAYRTIVACGVVTIGAAPPETLDLLASQVAVGDHLAFSFNDHALADEAYTSRLDALLDDGFEQLVAEYGPNLAGLESGATVYVLRRAA